jgi:predicted transcriptional regulator YdeE
MTTSLNKDIVLVGLRLSHKTANANGQAAQDIGQLWQRFQSDQIGNQIVNKVDNTVYSVYFEYDGDYRDPFSYFIGCPVTSAEGQPDHLESITIPSGSFEVFQAKGKMPDCIGEAWQSIWAAKIDRAYQCDFEVYDERSYDWQNAEVDIYIGVV